MKNILAVIVNYGDEQLQYLEEVVTAMKNFKKYNVTIIVNSNIPLNIAGIDHVNTINLEDYQLLPSTCKQVIWHYRDDFDGFLYTENDHLWLEHHIDNHLKYSEVLPDNRIPGLIQYEQNSDDGEKYYCAFGFGHNHLIPGSKEEYGDYEFSRLSNVHQASYFITKKQLDLVVERNPNYFTHIDNRVKTLTYSVKCRVNTDLFEFSGFEKVVCISEFDQNLIKHLPAVYINGTKGRPQMRGTQEEMNKWLSMV